MSDPQQEYIGALAAYRDALERLREAKRHIPQKPHDRAREREREASRLRREAWQQHREAYLAAQRNDPPSIGKDDE